MGVKKLPNISEQLADVMEHFLSVVLEIHPDIIGEDWVQIQVRAEKLTREWFEKEFSRADKILQTRVKTVWNEKTFQHELVDFPAKRAS